MNSCIFHGQSSSNWLLRIPMGYHGRFHGILLWTIIGERIEYFTIKNGEFTQKIQIISTYLMVSTVSWDQHPKWDGTWPTATNSLWISPVNVCLEKSPISALSWSFWQPKADSEMLYKIYSTTRWDLRAHCNKTPSFSPDSSKKLVAG